MTVGGIDLNLLVVLQALLEEGNVTRAGARVGMPQPAMSNALARLRRHYRDELLLRAGNGYTLTPLARSLLPSVHESVRLTGHAFSPADHRQPPPGDHSFALGFSDSSVTVLAGPLLRRVRALAPQVSISLRPVTPPEVDDRALLACDLLVAPTVPRPEVLWAEEVVLDRFVYVADPANPWLRDGRLSLADLAAAPHAAAQLPHGQPDPAAAALTQHGITPDVMVTTGGWLALPFLVAGTDLVAAVPERLEPPFGPVEITETAWWHPMRGTDPALTWLRTTLKETAALLDPDHP